MGAGHDHAGRVGAEIDEAARRLLALHEEAISLRAAQIARRCGVAARGRTLGLVTRRADIMLILYIDVFSFCPWPKTAGLGLSHVL